MYSDDAVRALYRDGKLVVDATRDLAVVDDLIRWAREDLDEALLDLKLALMDGDADEVDMRSAESIQLIRTIRRHMRGET